MRVTPRSWLVAIFLVGALASIGFAWAGGIFAERPRTPEEKHAEEIKAQWERRGLAAIPELIDAVCKGDELLATGAREVLEGLGKNALGGLARASDRPRCDLAGIIADILCHGGGGESELLGMLRHSNPESVRTALYVLAHLGSERTLSRCTPAAPVIKQVAPALGPLLRSRTGKDLREVIWAAAECGPDAAPLVPDLLDLLHKDDDTANGAASALGDIGKGAFAAVPALRARLSRGGHGMRVAIVALGNIGIAARPALPQFAPALEQALPGLCASAPRYAEADAMASAVAHATSTIGGPEAAPLVPDMVTAFRKMRACGLLAGSVGTWIDWFADLGQDGLAAEGPLLAIAEDADAPVDLRRRALDALDRVGSPMGSWWSLRAIRKALDRKRDLFDRGGSEPPMQILPPPPRTPREYALCRQEAGLPPRPEPRELDDETAEARRPFNWSFAECVRRRLCGPDERTYRKTMQTCCAGSGANPPWYCKDR